MSFMSARRGSHTIERLPSARGPHSMRPWNQPTTCSRGDRLRRAPAKLDLVVDPFDPAAAVSDLMRALRKQRLDLVVVRRRPKIGVLHDHPALEVVASKRDRRTAPTLS